MYKNLVYQIERDYKGDFEIIIGHNAEENKFSEYEVEEENVVFKYNYSSQKILGVYFLEKAESSTAKSVNEIVKSIIKFIFK